VGIRIAKEITDPGKSLTTKRRKELRRVESFRSRGPGLWQLNTWLLVGFKELLDDSCTKLERKISN